MNLTKLVKRLDIDLVLDGLLGIHTHLRRFVGQSLLLVNTLREHNRINREVHISQTRLHRRQSQTRR